MPRRHDLDALRGGAMLLGIGLHAALSFHPSAWPVQDRAASEWFALFTGVIHGFRMPLFFLLSGFFTMMLYRKRGGRGLLTQRGKRILGPCVAGTLTIVPLVFLVSAWAMSSAAPPSEDAWSPLVRAIRARDAEQVVAELERGAAIDAPDDRLGITPLAWSALLGDEPMVKLLLERGANPVAPNHDGATPLHAAAFRGYDQIAQLLLERGANPKVANPQGETPFDSLRVSAEVTSYIERLVGIPARPALELAEGRERTRAALEAAIHRDVEQRANADASTSDAKAGNARTDDPSMIANDSAWRSWGRTRTAWTQAYRKWLAADFWRVAIGEREIHLVQTEIFSHLWFLWYLWWLAVAFVGCVAAAKWLGWTGWLASRSEWLLSPVRFAWLTPLTCLPLLFMNPFGPDTSPGLVPPPHLFLYYAIFFGVGAWYFDASDRDGRVGRRWKTLLAISLLVGFPSLIMTMGVPEAHAVANACYAWGMTFGLMGLARATLSTERPAVRFLSDSSYWLYLAHLPLVMLLQAVCRDWPGPAVIKFLCVVMVTTLSLLASYRWLVRPTWLGRWLNGPTTNSSLNATAAQLSATNSTPAE